MNTWTALERGWCIAALDTMIPAYEALPPCGRVSLEAFWRLFETTAPALLRWGFRLSVWSWVLSTCVLARVRFGRSTPAQRHVALERMNAGSYPARQLTVTLKVVATLAYFSSPLVRQHFEAS